MLRGFFCITLIGFLWGGMICATDANQWYSEWILDPEEWVSPRFEHGFRWTQSLTPWHEGKGTLVWNEEGLHLQDALWRYDRNESSLAVLYGGSGWTSPDPWRLVHRSRFGRSSAAIVAEHDGSSIGWGKDLEGPQESLLGAVWLVRPLTHYRLGMLGYHMPWQLLGGRWNEMSGARLSLDGIREEERASLKWAWLAGVDQKDIDGSMERTVSMGGAISLAWASEKIGGDLEWLYIPADVRSPLTAYSSYPFDRYGVRGSVHGQWQTLAWTYEFQELQRIRGEREYVRQRLQVGVPLAGSQLHVDLRILPNAYWSVEWAKGSVLVQRHQGEQRWRLQWGRGSRWTRVDLADQGRIRWEVRWSRSHFPRFSGRLVYRFDWMESKSTTHVSAQFPVGVGDVSVEWGRYDRGNIRNHWNASPFAAIRWTMVF